MMLKKILDAVTELRGTNARQAQKFTSVLIEVLNGITGQLQVNEINNLTFRAVVLQDATAFAKLEQLQKYYQSLPTPTVDQEKLTELSSSSLGAAHAYREQVKANVGQEMEELGDLGGSTWDAPDASTDAATQEAQAAADKAQYQIDAELENAEREAQAAQERAEGLRQQKANVDAKASVKVEAKADTDFPED